RYPARAVAATRSATSPSLSGSATELPPYFCTTIGCIPPPPPLYVGPAAICSFLSSTAALDSPSMRTRRWPTLTLLAVAAATASAVGCATTGGRRAAKSPTRVQPIALEDEYDVARAEFDALAIGAPGRPAERAALLAYLTTQIGRDLDRGHPEEAYDAFK